MFGTFLSKDHTIIVRGNFMISIDIQQFNHSWCKFVTILIIFFNFSKILRRILPDAYFLIIIIYSKRFTYKPAITYIIYFSIIQFYNFFLIS